MELTTQEFLRDLLLTLAEYDSGEVIINGWSILDGSLSRSPYIIIENAASIDSAQNRAYTYDLPTALIVAFVDWDESLNNFRDYRQNIFDLLAANNSVTQIRSTTEIAEMHDVYNRHDDSLPVFLMQKFIVSVVAKES